MKIISMKIISLRQTFILQHTQKNEKSVLSEVSKMFQQIHIPPDESRLTETVSASILQ